jgi:hypothetical protein
MSFNNTYGYAASYINITFSYYPVLGRSLYSEITFSHLLSSTGTQLILRGHLFSPTRLYGRAAPHSEITLSLPTCTGVQLLIQRSPFLFHQSVQACSSSFKDHFSLTPTCTGVQLSIQRSPLLSYFTELGRGFNSEMTFSLTPTCTGGRWWS